MRVFYTIISLLLLGLIYYAGYQRGSGSPQSAYQRDSAVVHYDTLPVIASPDTIRITSTEKVPVPHRVDTAAIIEAWAERRSYLAKAEANQVQITARPIIFQNRLDSISFEIKNLRPTSVQHYSARPRHALAAGLVIGPDLSAPMLQYRYKRLHAGLGYNVTGRQGLVVAASYTLIEF